MDKGQGRMGEKRKEMLSASPVVNDHMRGGEQKGNDDPTTHEAHHDKDYACVGMHVKEKEAWRRVIQFPILGKKSAGFSWECGPLARSGSRP